jgi:hypothetical protein
MKFKLVSLFILFLNGSFLTAMEKQLFQMPEETVLTKNLKEMNFDNLIQYTDLTKRLAGKEILPGSLVMIVDEEWEEESKRIKTERNDSKALAIFNLNKPLVYTALLKGMPEAWKQVQEFLKQAEELVQEMSSEEEYKEKTSSSDDESYLPAFTSSEPNDSSGY